MLGSDLRPKYRPLPYPEELTVLWSSVERNGQSREVRISRTNRLQGLGKWPRKETHILGLNEWDDCAVSWARMSRWHREKALEVLSYGMSRWGSLFQSACLSISCSAAYPTFCRYAWEDIKDGLSTWPPAIHVTDQDEFVWLLASSWPSPSSCWH